MALAKRRSMFPSFFDEFNDLFNIEGFGSKSSLPAVNIKENEKDYRLEVAAPGMDSKDFNVEVDNDTMTISCQHENTREEKKEEENYTRREYNFQSFQRSFTLPEGADAEHVEANYRNGVLNITIPKKEEEKQKHKVRKIDIR
jgi:HSP20 family protein